MYISKQVKERVRNKFGGNCAYCGHAVADDFQVDHKISKCYFWLIDPLDRNSVNREENLYPSCRTCNHYKRSMVVDDCESTIGFRTYMMNFHRRLGKLPKRTMVPDTVRRIAYMWNIANRYGITPENPFSGTFFYETYNCSSPT
jgi:hypothetical protein